MGKTWAEKMKGSKAPHIAVIDKPMSGLLPGQKLLVASPELVKDYIAGIPSGTTRTIAAMRDEMARAKGADATCAMSAGIFVRIVAEAALEELRSGRKLAQIAPFWRLIDPESATARKLTCGPEFIREQRGMERR